MPHSRQSRSSMEPRCAQPIGISRDSPTSTGGIRSTQRRDQPTEPAMFVIELIYKVDLAKIDAHMAAHVRFLKKYYASGHFLVSGRKIPRDGGIILAVGKDRREVEAIAHED